MPAQKYKFHYNNEYLSDVRFGNNQENSFNITFSLVANFTSGAKDKNNFRLGFGLVLSQTINNWTFSLGTDIYKETQNMGPGISYAGIKYLNNNYGGAYYLTHYYQDGKQTSGLIRLFLNEVQILFEDDLLSYPFVGFKIHDRYRSAAMEIRYKGWMAGSNVYTTDVNGVTDFSTKNPKGTFHTGYQLSSPWYIGYSSHGILLRAGYNNSRGGFIGQNFWHRLLFQTPDFLPGNYSHPFLQFGTDKPYTLY
ncbi:hypothetical protein LJB92_04065 [Bacteroidales bacterium OttesenSCG-928-M06]|nr:hypothetical protein [Bacteroidales bacterium OttesenSCG-928-M06]